MVVKLDSLHFHNLAMRFAKFRHFLITTFWFIETSSFKSRQIPMTSTVPLDDRQINARQKKSIHADKHTLMFLHVEFYHSSISRNVIFGSIKLGGATSPIDT